MACYLTTLLLAGSSVLVAGVKASLYYQNPVIGYDAPDPGVMYDPASKAWYATTTSAECDRSTTPMFPIWKSTDLAAWNFVGYIFPHGGWPTWVMQDCWAPEIHLVNGVYTAYFVGRNSNGILSIGVAISKGDVLGPYVDAIGHELVTNTQQPGMIDPHYFKDDDGQGYLLWKKDGNSVGQETPIFLSRLSPNGTALLDTNWPTLIHNDQAWEGPLVEAPWMVKKNSTYFLFYSGVAQAKSITGPYTKLTDPIVANATGSTPAFVGPGHCSVIQAQDGGYGILYHAWPYAPAVNFSMPRFMMLDDVSWSNGASMMWPSVASGSPSSNPQPVP